MRPSQNNLPEHRFKPNNSTTSRFVPEGHFIPPTLMERSIAFGGFGSNLGPRYPRLLPMPPVPPMYPMYRGRMGPPPPRPYSGYTPRRPMSGMMPPNFSRRFPYPAHVHFMPPYMRYPLMGRPLPPHMRLLPHDMLPHHLSRHMAQMMRPLTLSPRTHRPPPTRAKKNNNTNRVNKKRNPKQREPKPKEPKPLPNPEDSFLEDMTQPWITAEIRYEFNKKQHLSQVARSTRCDADWAHFKFQRERCHSMIRMSRDRYYEHLRREADRIAEENMDFTEDNY